MQEHIFISLQISQLRSLIIECVNECLERKPFLQTVESSDLWFDVNSLSEYLPSRPKRQTIYGYIYNKRIPFHKNDGEKKPRFLKSEIDDWLRQGKKKTSSEIEAETISETDSFLSTLKRKGGKRG